MDDYKKYLGKIAVTLAQFEGMPEGQIVKIVATLTKNWNNSWIESRYQLAIIVPKNCEMTPRHPISNHLWDNYNLEYKILEGINPNLNEYYYISKDYVKIIKN